LEGLQVGRLRVEEKKREKRIKRRDAENTEITRRGGESADVVSNDQMLCYRTCILLVKINYYVVKEKGVRGERMEKGR
jgi:hypothetical protein